MFKITIKDYCKKQGFSDAACTAFVVWLGAYSLEKHYPADWDMWFETYSDAQGSKLPEEVA